MEGYQSGKGHPEVRGYNRNAETEERSGRDQRDHSDLNIYENTTRKPATLYSSK